MSSTHSNSQRDAITRSYWMKGVLAGVVILLSIAFLTWMFWPTPPVVIPPADNPAAQWTRAFAQVSTEHAAKQDAFYWLTSKISTQPTDDNQGIIVKGKVATPADLNTLKAEIAKVQPSVPIQWQVTLGS